MLLRSQLSVHVWRCSCVWERKRLETIDESTLYWCLSLVRRHSSSLKSCLLRWSYLKSNETLTSTSANRLLLLISNVFVWLRSLVRSLRRARAPTQMKWRNAAVHCRHQWLSLILNRFSCSDCVWSDHDAESAACEKKEKAWIYQTSWHLITRQKKRAKLRKKQIVHTKRICWLIGDEKGEVHDEAIRFAFDAFI